MSQIFYIKTDYYQEWSSAGPLVNGASDTMKPETRYITKTDGSAFISDGDAVYVWGVAPNAEAIESGRSLTALDDQAENWTYRGQVALENGTFAPWLQRTIDGETRWKVLLPAGQPLSDVNTSFLSTINPSTDGRDWADYNNNGWALESTLGSTTNADLLGPLGALDLDFEPGAHAPSAEPGDVRFVDPPPDDSPLRAIQGTTAYGRADDDPETVETITYAFGEAGIELGDGIVTSEWQDWQKDAYRAAHAIYEDVANVRFVEVSDTADAMLDEYVADISSAADARLFGFQQFPALSTTYGFLNAYFFGWSDGVVAEPGGRFFGTILHEQGHGLGLGHPHDDGNGTTVMRGVDRPDDPGDFDMNLRVNTVMSYNLPLTKQVNPLGEFGGMLGLGALDIAAIQNMYGANTTTRTGDDVYRLDEATGAGAGFIAIWDAGGVDTIRYDGDRQSRIALLPAPLAEEENGGGYLSFVDGVRAGRTIAHGVTIENAIGGTGDDRIYGNDVDNVLRGRDRNDSLKAGAGDDRVLGGGGNDTAEGDDGDDVVVGRAGDDLLTGGAGDDRVHGGGGADGLGGDAGDDRLLGGAGDDSMVGNDGADSLRGGAGADVIGGGAGADLLVGAAGDDALSGHAGVDRIAGLAGSDTLYGGAQGDVMRGGADGDLLFGEDGDDALFGGGGGDELQGGAGDDRVLGHGGDDLLLGGGGGDVLKGNAGADSLDGENGDDRLFGGKDDDILAGGAGADRLSGGVGADRFVFEAGDGQDNVVRDFTPRMDRLVFVDIEGVTRFDDLEVTGDAGGAVIAARDVVVTLANVAPEDVTAGDVLFELGLG